MEENNTQVSESKLGLGLLNGIFCYDYIWPFFCIGILKIILQNNYSDLVSTKSYSMSLILMIMNAIVTLGIGIIIASPKSLQKVIKKVEDKNFKLIFLSLGFMMLFTFSYNLILLLSGIDVSGGNANQSNVLEYINNAPVLSLVSMVILAPLVEELTYRYFLYGGISKYNRKLAIVLSGFVFMCVHATASFATESVDIVRELLLLPPYMFSGMVLAYSYDKTNNLAIPISIHALNNLISFILSVL